MVSASRDGQYIADFISILGLKSLRGSSSKKGANAYRAGIKAVKEGYNVSFTPDGPRGPRYVMKTGPISLASVTGTGVIPISVNASRCWSVRSWDGFQIPKPFSTLTLILGDMVMIPPDLDEDGLELYREKVEAALMAVTADRRNGPENRFTIFLRFPIAFGCSGDIMLPLSPSAGGDRRCPGRVCRYGKLTKTLAPRLDICFSRVYIPLYISGRFDPYSYGSGYAA